MRKFLIKMVLVLIIGFIATTILTSAKPNVEPLSNEDPDPVLVDINVIIEKFNARYTPSDGLTHFYCKLYVEAYGPTPPIGESTIYLTVKFYQGSKSVILKRSFKLKPSYPQYHEFTATLDLGYSVDTTVYCDALGEIYAKTQTGSGWDYERDLRETVVDP
ncbi:MAG: hypothetical protein DRN53_02095 [Thermoprotei archaeon]|nr:MAG: hypothetical protein DRN53_02095 [Thermoprotei archaeon]